jgi:hypothetical protein
MNIIPSATSTHLFIFMMLFYVCDSFSFFHIVNRCASRRVDWRRRLTNSNIFKRTAAAVKNKIFLVSTDFEMKKLIES